MELPEQQPRQYHLLLAYESRGTKWYTFFYEPANWIPFIFYFAAGAVCGYVRMKKQGKSGIYIRGESADPGKISLYA